MARYKGRSSARTVAHEFPHMVEMPLPRGGLGSPLDAMHDWHIARGIKSQRGPERCEVIDALNSSYFCFL